MMGKIQQATWSASEAPAPGGAKGHTAHGAGKGDPPPAHPAHRLGALLSPAGLSEPPCALRLVGLSPL